MILRKLAESIRSQDWFVVIIEILIVVVGIFLGLQVDDWNQQRKDRADEQVFLETDVALLNNGLRLPLLMALSCTIGDSAIEPANIVNAIIPGITR